MGRLRWTCYALGTLFIIPITIVIMVMAGCGSGGTTSGVSGSQQIFTQSFNNQIDILWVVDNSGSMAPLQTNMTTNFQSFIQNFQTVGYDYRMAMTATDAYKANTSFVGYSSANSGLSLFQDGGHGTGTSGVFVILPSTPNLDTVFLDNATTGINGSSDERAFSSMMTTLNNTSNTAFPRPTAFFAIIILSDEDDFSNYNRLESSWGSNAAADHCYYDTAMDTTATTAYSGTNHVSTCAGLSPQTPPDTVVSYESALDTLTGSTGSTRRWSVSTIAVLDSACQLSHSQSTQNNDSAFVSVIGQRYIQISQDSQGYQGSICDASYATSLSSIASNIVALSTQFFLNQTPQIGSIVVTVNGLTAIQNATNGWQYNSAANSIMFYGTAVPPQGAQIVVTFNPAIVQTEFPLEISNFQISNLTQTGATFSWNTNNNSNSVVSIAPYPSTTYTATTDKTMTMNHSETITGLTNFTIYNVFVTSTDGSGNSSSTVVTTFRTSF